MSIDLSSEFHPIPKVFRPKKVKKSIRKIGKKGRASLDAVAQMKVKFQEMGILTCEVRFPSCWGTQGLGFAHAKKRRKLKLEDLMTAILSCNFCHSIFEVWPAEKMEKLVMDIIRKRRFS